MTQRALPHPLHRTAALVRRLATAATLAAGDGGQATAEYGLVILAAGAIALGVIAWARGTNGFTDLFQSVVGRLTSDL